MAAKARTRYKGQSAMIVALLVGLGVLIGLVAIAFDGGSALVQRRTMQNAADSAALADVKSLAASIVISGGTYVYNSTNQDLINVTNQFLVGNRGGVTGAATYRATVDYGSYNGSTYVYTNAATYNGSTWTYALAQTDVVPVWTDAIRVTAQVDNPTTFGRTIGINSVSVGAKSAAALRAAINYTPQGPTWPMTAVYTGTLDPSTGICNPVLFWSNPGGNFKDLMQLGAEQGASYEGAHRQLLTQFDTRGSLSDATGTTNYTQCPPGQTPGQWIASGNCSTNPSVAPYGTFCCSGSNNNGPVDVNNWITHDFTGRLSLTATTWLGDDGQPHDWRSAYNSSEVGDWPEVYNGGNFGSNVQQPLYNYIIDPNHRLTDDLFQYYGYHVDKVMYLFDKAEIWKKGDHSYCNPQCPNEWQPISGNDTQGRVHVKVAYIFRFYQQMASQGGFSTPAARCGVSTSFSTSGSKIYGVFVGEEVSGPPPDPGPHGLYNYVGYIEP